MVTLSKCSFCEKTYGDAEEHRCDERKTWEDTLIGIATQNECQFCEKTYGCAEEHYCDERKAWENTLMYQGQQAGKALEEFTRTIMEEAIKSRKALEKIFKKKDKE